MTTRARFGLAVQRAGRRAMWPALATAVLAAFISLGVLPARTYLEKKEAVATAEAELADLQARNDKAQAHVDALESDAEIERIAREQYGLVKPGDEKYQVLPAPEDPVVIPDAWPFNRLHQSLGR